MRKTGIVVVVTILLVFTLIGSAFASGFVPFASSIFDSASISLNSSMTATFKATTMQNTTIKVTSCTLQKKVNGVWQNASSLTAPPSASSTLKYVETKDYSSQCTGGTIYRISATFSAGDETLTRTSGEVKY